MTWINKCECSAKNSHHAKIICPNEPIFLVRVSIKDCEGYVIKEVIRAVCGDCHFIDTPILGRYNAKP